MEAYPATTVPQPTAAGVADGEQSAEQPAPIGGKRCFVNNLAWRTSWQDLKDHFRGNGTVVFANVIRDQAGNLCLALQLHSSSCNVCALGSRYK